MPDPGQLRLTRWYHAGAVTPGRPKDRRRARRWYAIGFATVLLCCSYVLLVYALAAASNDETTFAGGVAGVGLGLVPTVFICAATVSDRARPLRASALAVIVWLAVAAPLAFVDVPTALVAGFGAGGAVALAGDPETSRRPRVLAVVTCTLYVLVLQWLLAPAGLLVGALLPFVAIGVADGIGESEPVGDLDGAATP